MLKLILILSSFFGAYMANAAGTCPPNFKDIGAHCMKPQPEGRGVGSTTECKDCEKCGLLYYPKCKAGFHAVGCNICSPDCPKDMKDIGVSCQK